MIFTFLLNQSLIFDRRYTVYFTPPVLDVVDFKLCIDKNSELVKELPAIDQEIRNIRKDGTLKKILDKWK